MRTHADRRQVGALAGTAREHVATIIDGDRAADRLAGALEPVTDLAVVIGQREPADAAFRRTAEARRFHQAVPQPLRIDRQIGAVGLGRSCHGLAHGTTGMLRDTGLGAENSFQVLLATCDAGNGGRAMNCPSPFSARSSPSCHAMRPPESVMRGAPVQATPSNTL